MNNCEPIDVLQTYVAGQARLGYASFDPGPLDTDVILATFPKSGSTWMSYVLYQLTSGGDEGFSDIKDVVFDITPGHWDPDTNPFEMAQKFEPRTFKTHGSWRHAPKGGRYIYISRNPSDIFWSLYNFIHDLFGMEERVEVEEFYQQYFVDRFGTDHDIGNVWNHILDWLPHRNDDNVLWLHYEDLRENFPVCVSKIAAFMDVELTDDLQHLVLERATMDHARSMADKLNPSQMNHTGKVTLKFGREMEAYAQGMKFGKIRRGKVGDGEKELPQAIKEKLAADWQQRITSVLGYDDYAAMRRECSLLRS